MTELLIDTNDLPLDALYHLQKRWEGEDSFRLRWLGEDIVKREAELEQQ